MVMISVGCSELQECEKDLEQSVLWLPTHLALGGYALGGAGGHIDPTEVFFS